MADTTTPPADPAAPPAHAAPAAAPAPLDVVRFTFRDPIFGTEIHQLGIVAGDPEDGRVAIAPVAGFALTVDLADVELVDTEAEDG